MTYREAVVWRQTKNKTIEYTGKEAWFHFAACFFTYAFVIYTTVCILGELFPVTVGSIKGRSFLLGEILVCQVVYEQLFPRLERKWKSRQAFLMRLVVAGIGLALAVRFSVRYYENDAVELEDGFLQIGKIFLYRVNIHFNTNYYLNSGVEEKVPLAVTFLLVMLIFLFFNLSYIINKRKVWLVLPFFLCCAYLFVGLSPQWKGMLLCCLCLYFFSLLGEEKAVLWKPYYKNTHDKRRPAKAIIQGLLPLGLLLLCFLLVTVLGKSASQKLLCYSPQVKEFQLNLELGLKSRLSGGDLSGFTGRKSINNKEPVYTGKEVIFLLSDRKPEENLYLKAYQGGSYERGSWKQEKGTFTKACKAARIDIEEMQELLAGAAYDKVAGESDSVFGNEAFVGQTGLDSIYASQLEIRHPRLAEKSMYAPYFTKVDEEFKGSLWGDVLLKKRALSGKVSLEYLAANPSSLLESGEVSEEKEQLWDFYSDFVKEQYLEVTEELPGLNKVAWQFGFVSGRANDTEMNADRIQAVGKVNSFLSNYQYSQKLPELSGDPVEYFLTVSKKGYCVHFAAAGTLILRKMGVPARYCSGYIVKKGDWTRTEEGYEAHIPDSNAHAWVEIYLERIGWIPVEMTPGYSASISSGTTDVLGGSDYNEVDSSSGDTSSGTDQEESESPSEESDGEGASTQSTEEDENAQSGEKENTSTQKPDDGGIFGLWGNGGNALTQESDGEGLQNSWGSGENFFTQNTGDGEFAQDPNRGGEMSSQNYGPGAENRSVFAIVITTILKLLLGLAVVCIVAFLVIHKVRSYQRQVDLEYQRGYYKKVVRRINRRLYKGLRRTGKLISLHPTDAQLRAALEKRYPEIPAEEWAAYMEVVKCAAFSQNELSKEQAKVVYELYKMLH